jgi:poly-gamma-glutamate synthesis protein (capsule biosynthesis protein)
MHLLAAILVAALAPKAASGEERPDAGTAPASPEVTLAAVGDILLARHVAEAMAAHHDPNYPFLGMHDLLRAADVAFGNLEGPITSGAAVKSKEMVFRADPGVERALKDAGFAVLSVANNHTPDHGAKGITDTLSALKAVGIEAVGLGADSDEAARPVILTRNGLRIAFLAYNDPSVVPRRYGAGAHHPGTNLADADKVRRDVAAVRSAADVVIVSMHHGWEYRQSNPYQAKFARAAIDAGADLVIGHHPHVVQRVEQYRGKYIVYSLGNFVFDQTFSDAVQEGVILRARLSKAGVTGLQFLPFRIHNASQPRLSMDPAVRSRLQSRLQIPLSPDGTVVTPASNVPPR